MPDQYILHILLTLNLTLKLQDFWYELPEWAIAQEPLGERDEARLLVDQAGVAVEHRRVADLPEFLREGDVVVVNDARVLPARMKLWKATGGEVEVLALRPLGGDGNRDAEKGLMGNGGWEALVRPSRKVQPGALLHLADGRPVLRVGERLAEGKREVFPVEGETLEELMAQAGQVPLPPYIHTPLPDSERYQSIYAKDATAAAAPTAGLHLTQRVLDGLAAKGIPVYALNLAVGLGTFRPITEDDIADHHIHTEEYHIPAETWQACLQAKQQGGRVVAIGTTVVRALETAYSKAHRQQETSTDTEDLVSNQVRESSDLNHLHGESDLYITPGYRFGIVDVLMTNFHLPHSTLLVLLAAFMGPRWRELYQTALAEGYRFLSFGDAMLVSSQ